MSATETSPLPRVLSRLVAFLLPVVYFMVTVSFYLRTYDSAQIKITLTQIGCTLVILLWFCQLLLERRWPFEKKDMVLVAPFLAMLGSGLLAFAQSSFTAGAVDETVRRVLYVFMGLIVVSEFRGWDRHRRLLRWLMAAFFVAVFYGFVQFFDTRLFPPGQGLGIDPFVWRHAFGLRPFSTFGNPNFYGNFLVLITPIILAIYLRSGGHIFRPFLMIGVMVFVVYATDHLLTDVFGGVSADARTWYKLGLAVSFVFVIALTWWKAKSAAASGTMLFFCALFLSLYSTETKGAWLGFIGALIGTTLLIGFFFTGAQGRSVAKKLFIAMTIIAILGASVVAFYARRRMASVNFRVFTWIATWEMIRTQPILGAGIGTFKWAYPAFRRPEIILIEGKSNTETDHSEDEYLEVWHDEGAVGFGFFLWLILMVSVLGVRALNTLTSGSAQGPPSAHDKEKAYSILAFLGAYWGGLVHWFVDVSIRFVSSGVYSFLLPGLVVSLIRQDHMPLRQDPPWALDRWLRAGIAVFWFLVLHVFLDVSLVPSFSIAASLWLLSQALDWKLTPEEPMDEQAVPEEAWADNVRGVSWWRWPVVLALVAGWIWCFGIFRNFFMADINHNMAIFFSKQGLWTKNDRYDAQAASLPADMKKEYDEVGGALEHYEKVMRLNPFFPMARYFIGNVYNDWGSGFFNESEDARRAGRVQDAERLRGEAIARWEKALEAYDKVKKFAPNYVQTHHQVGLVYLKLGDLWRSWGDEAKTKDFWDLALKNFALYQNLDPVFPPNHYRIGYIHFSRSDYDATEKAYLGALTHNMNANPRYYYADRNAETYVNLGRLFYIRLVNENPGRPELPAESEQFKKSVAYYEKALAEASKNDVAAAWRPEALKGLAILYSRANIRDKASALWMELRTLTPDDPDVKRVFGQAGG